MVAPGGGTPFYKITEVADMVWYCNISQTIDEVVSDRFFLIQDRLFYSGGLQKKPYGEKISCIGSENRDFFINSFMYI